MNPSRYPAILLAAVRVALVFPAATDEGQSPPASSA
jgi:hypothetical protein